MAEGEPEMQGKAVEENSPAKAEKSKDELWETYVSLQEELNRAVKEKGPFENERSSLTTSWNTSKQRLEASKARMREKLRVKSRSPGANDAKKLKSESGTWKN
ncbi:dynein regulatory complex subunit 4-like [Pseudochaenichthys georgianus]|uniref:dynein regulatory complex subunit 4-like n=1 Tax=Pseudochaenichthys georgianus TaxID=52239 RepID=UPI0039C2F83F